MASVVYNNPEITDSKPGCEVHLKYGFGPVPRDTKFRKVFLFDIDNCLYLRSTEIHDMMQVKIHQYFKEQLLLSDEDANELHLNYYKTYGLALEGLVRNHQVDALEYNSKVDDLLDLKSVLEYNEALRKKLIDLKQTSDYDCFWLITNAYKNHALRVISFLGLGDLFDGLTYCDYAQNPIVCKPMAGFFHGCFDTINVQKPDYTHLSFIDDSTLNVKAAADLGVGFVYHFVETDDDLRKVNGDADYQKYYESGRIRIVRDLLELQ